MAINNTEYDSGSGSESDHNKGSDRSPSPSSRSGSGSPAQGSRSPSRSPTPQAARSGSASPGKSGSDRSRSQTPKSGSGSRSGSANSDRSRSGSAKSNRSRSGSAKSNRSRSGSAKSNRSRSGSEKSNRSHSGSPKSNRSRSGSPKSNRSRSESPKVTQSGRDSGDEIESNKRKLSDGSDTETKKKNKLGSDESADENLVIDAEALFGNASDISDEDESKKQKETSQDADSEKEEKASDAEAASNDEREKENVPEEPETLPETRIEVEIPKITTDLGKELHFVKLPNFLSVETRPFDPDTYEDEIDEEETLDEEGRARLKLKVENTIRWRETETSKGTKRESNARFVRWSDGSMSLHLGSEVFDVYKQPLQGDHNHLFIRQGTGLQGQAVFRTKLSFRPHSTESFTHRKMTMSLADRSNKTSGVKMLSLVGKDPEAHRGELIKKEEEKLRATVRRESRQRRVREKGASRGLSAGYLEPDRFGDGDIDSDEEAISINAIKKHHKDKTSTKGDRPNIYSSDEDGSDIETRRARRLDKAKAIKDSDDDESDAGKKSVNSDSDD